MHTQTPEEVSSYEIYIKRFKWIVFFLSIKHWNTEKNSDLLWNNTACWGGIVERLQMFTKQD